MATLDVNDINDTAVSTAVSSNSMITLFVTQATGTSTQYIVGIEVSPDSGTTWIPCHHTLQGTGFLVVEIAATNARAYVIAVEGSASTVNVWLLAR